MSDFDESNIIAAYTRKQAIADGNQIKLSVLYPDECKLYKYPVFCTKAVWTLIESAVNNSDHHNDYRGVVWDILHMSIHAPGRKEILGGAGIEFTVMITGGDRTPDFHEGGQPVYRMHCVCGAMDIDDGTPAMTIMFPDED